MRDDDDYEYGYAQFMGMGYASTLPGTPSKEEIEASSRPIGFLHSFLPKPKKKRATNGRK